MKGSRQMNEYIYPEKPAWKRVRTIFIIILFAVSVFELLHGAFLSLTAQYMRPYATAVVIFSVFFLLSAVVYLIKPHSLFKYVVSLVFVAVGSIGMAATGYILTHPVVTDDYYITGVSEGTFWKLYAPCLILIFPAVAVMINELRRRRLEEENRPYEKQFK